MSGEGEVGEHTRTQTEHGPDYCAECSKAAQEWVTWPCSAAVPGAGWGYEQMLRADRAELALREADGKLARLLQMADSWEEAWGDKGVKASTISHAVRVTIRSHE